MHAYIHTYMYLDYAKGALEASNTKHMYAYMINTYIQAHTHYTCGQFPRI